MSKFKEIRCPCETCYGWVSEVEEDGSSLFYGCGSCGNVWRNRSDLYDAVTSILEKYPYRAAAYLITKEGYFATDLDEEPEDYEERIVDEWNNA